MSHCPESAAMGTQRQRRRLALAAMMGAALGLLPAAAAAHFMLISPPATLVQDDRGNPQKLGPCGGTSADAGTPTGAVTQLRGGDAFPLRLKNTASHPGHYRVALARSAEQLPADPETQTKPSDRGPVSVSARIEQRPRPPILADGLFQHSDRPTPGGIIEADLRVPNFDCVNCVLQVIQWMGDHRYNADGGYSYHHCATVNIVRNPRLKLNEDWASLALLSSAR